MFTEECLFVNMVHKYWIWHRKKGRSEQKGDGVRERPIMYIIIIINIIIIIIYPLTARVVGTPLMILQPVSFIFAVLYCPLGLCELKASPFPDVVFLSLPLPALFSSPFHCALQDGFGQIWWTGDMTMPLQFASLYNGQEVFVWSDCLLDLDTDFLVGNMVFVWDV